MWMFLLLVYYQYNVCFCENKSQLVCRSLDLLKMNRAKETFHIIYESKNVCSCLAAGTITHCNWECKGKVSVARILHFLLSFFSSLIVARKSVMKIYIFKRKKSRWVQWNVTTSDYKIEDLVNISRFFGASAWNKIYICSIKHKLHYIYNKNECLKIQ